MKENLYCESQGNINSRGRKLVVWGLRGWPRMGACNVGGGMDEKGVCNGGLRKWMGRGVYNVGVKGMDGKSSL